ncbi:MAG: transcriptional regulator, partial [Frankiales bacterium]|nr:transcriptional regulator [Frankiales bacterium]
MTPARARFAEVVRSEPVDLGLACLLVGGEVEPDLDVDVSLTARGALAPAVRRQVPRGSSPAAAAVGLRAVLGEFAGSAR